MTLSEATGIHQCNIDKATGKTLSHRERYTRYIDYLGGLDAVEPYIPFELDYLLPRYREDRYFNNTWLATWNEAAERIKLLCYWNHVTCTSQAERVSVLKEAAAILCERATSECCVENEVLV